MNAAFAPNHTRRATRHDPYEVLAATLADLFQVPAEDAFRLVNQRLAANPLTADVRFEYPRLQPFNTK